MHIAEWIKGNRGRLGGHARRGGAAVAAAALIAGLGVTGVAGVAGAATSTKPFSLVFTPAIVPAGSPVTFTGVLTNQSNPQTIGSADVSINNTSTGFVLAPSTLANPLTISDPDSAAATIARDPSNPQMIDLRTLSLLPGHSVTFTISGFAPCVPENTVWTPIVKQSNDFSGPPGNNFAPDTSLPHTVATSGNCSLTFNSAQGGAQPASAVANTAITNQPFTSIASGAAAVQVAVLDATGTPITNTAAPGSTIPVSVALDTNPTGATLSGTTSTNAVSGVASFSNLSINLPTFTTGYTLIATSQDANTSPDSNSFLIWQTEDSCPANKACNALAKSNGSGQTTITGTPTTNSTIAVSLGVQSPLCTYTSAYAPFGTTYITNTNNFAPLTAMVTIQNPTASAKQYQVCYEQLSAPFTTASGTPSPQDATSGYYYGLLPNCATKAPVAPCVQNLAKSGSTVVETLLVLPGDPFTR